MQPWIYLQEDLTLQVFEIQGFGPTEEKLKFSLRHAGASSVLCITVTAANTPPATLSLVCLLKN